MFRYLSRHPEIYFPDRKEMHTFGSDLRFGPQFYRRSMNDYLAEFAPRNGELRAGEASVWYLLSTKAATEIKAFQPDADIIIMLREPSEMLHSLYHMFRYDRNEHLPTFKEALDAEPARSVGQLVTRQTYFAQGLVYRTVARYAEQVERYFNVFGRGRVHVILYDDFAADTPGTYREALEFLGVNPSIRPKFEVINGNRVVKSRLLNGLVNDSLVRAGALVMRPLVPSKLFVAMRTVRERLMQANLSFGKRTALDPELRARIKKGLEPEIERLSRLINRDLSQWLK